MKKIFNFNFEIGENVKCFDPSVYIDDVKTPLSITMRDAVIVARRFQVYYGQWTQFYDVKFEDRISTNHFESALIKNNSI